MPNPLSLAPIILSWGLVGSDLLLYVLSHFRAHASVSWQRCLGSWMAHTQSLSQQTALSIETGVSRGPYRDPMMGRGSCTWENI